MVSVVRCKRCGRGARQSCRALRVMPTLSVTFFCLVAASTALDIALTKTLTLTLTLTLPLTLTLTLTLTLSDFCWATSSERAVPPAGTSVARREPKSHAQEPCNHPSRSGPEGGGSTVKVDRRRPRMRPCEERRETEHACIPRCHGNSTPNRLRNRNSLRPLWPACGH